MKRNWVIAGALTALVLIGIVFERRQPEPETVVVVPIEKPSDAPVGTVGEPPFPNQPQPVYPPDVVVPDYNPDTPTGAQGEPPFANQPQPVYPDEVVPVPDKKPVVSKPKPKPKVKKPKPKPKVKKPKKKVVKKKRRVYHTIPKPDFYPEHFWQR